MAVNCRQNTKGQGADRELPALRPAMLNPRNPKLPPTCKLLRNITGRQLTRAKSVGAKSLTQQISGEGKRHAGYLEGITQTPANSLQQCPAGATQGSHFCCKLPLPKSRAFTEIFQSAATTWCSKSSVPS